MSNRLLAAGLTLAALGTVLAATDEAPSTPHPLTAFTGSTLTDSTPGTFGVYRVTLDDGSTHDLPGCEDEDSTNCFWDAGERGNGIGHSFADVNGVALYRAGGPS